MAQRVQVGMPGFIVEPLYPERPFGVVIDKKNSLFLRVPSNELGFGAGFLFTNPKP